MTYSQINPTKVGGFKRMKDKNGKRIEIGMVVKGELNRSVGYYLDCELEVLIKKGTIVEGEVIDSDGKLCVRAKCVMMPYLTMLKLNTREIQETRHSSH